ncbi:uncharacterized protein LOC111265383 isoform X2 [Varroa jacobsoni]|uniref:uncharacterized protein LOC111265383 isoform X2 n=1 Tax=Varroa jacobsoni TaxID=62625 RepID=UPI000BF348BA|nr:uncharacterized protein LOC111265383 isoform X2 [Varroa jacobsoni]
MTMATVAVFHWCFADASGNSMTCLSVRVRACEETNASSDSAAWKMYRVVLASLSRCPFSGQNVALFFLQSTSALRQNVDYLFNRRFNPPRVPPYSNYAGQAEQSAQDAPTGPGNCTRKVVTV